MTQTVTHSHGAHDIVVIPCLTDNYAFLLHHRESGRTALIDAPEAAPIRAELDARGWTLNEIVLTHHHSDHIQGVSALRAGTQVFGAAADAHRLPELDVMLVADGEVEICGTTAHVLDVSGHTNGHIALHFAELGVAFTADSLMAMGCGRLSEGTAPQMWESLGRLMALPPETALYSGHEYTAANMAFALSLEPENEALLARKADIDAARADDAPTVPATLGVELQTNPFLRAADPALQAALGLSGAEPGAVFTAARAAKDDFTG